MNTSRRGRVGEGGVVKGGHNFVLTRFDEKSFLFVFVGENRSGICDPERVVGTEEGVRNQGG